MFSIKLSTAMTNIKLLKSLLTIICISLVFACSKNENNRITLSGLWKFKNNDNLDYSKTKFDDSSWPYIEVPKRLEKQGYSNFKGIGWYRKHFKLPPIGKDQLMGIYFSNIADADQVYINGILLGESGSFNKNDKITPHFSKVYQVPETVIKPNGKNILAVRFFKQYGPFVGIFNKSPEIANYKYLASRVLVENFFKSYLILFSALFVLLLGAYHFLLYYFSKNRKDYLIFSITCIFAFFYESYLSFIPYSLIGNLTINAKINTTALVLHVFLLFWFILEYFDIKSKTLKNFNILVTFITVTSILIMGEPNIILKIYFIYFFFLAFFIFLMFYFSIKHVLFLKSKGNYFIPIGLLAIIFTGINDGLVTYGLYYSNLVTAYGFLFFIIGISISLANDFSNTYKAEQLKAKTLSNINETAIALSSELKIDKLLTNSIDILRKHLQVERCTIMLVNDVGELSENSTYMYGDDMREPLSEIDWAMSQTEVKPYIMKDIEDTFPGHKSQREVKKANKYRQLMLVPMVHHNKKIGLIAVSKKADDQDFTKDDKEFVSIIAPQLALAIENAAAYKDIEDQVQKQRDQLIMSEKMATIGQLTSGIGHEINNPVNFIISYVPPVRKNVESLVELLELYEQYHNSDGGEGKKEEISKKINEMKEKGKLDKKLPRILRSLDAITDGAKRVASIVDSLKHYARTDATPSDIDINDAIDKSLVILHNKLKNKVTVHKEYAPEVKSKCYSSINQVIVNLIGNAADAIAEQGEIFIKTSMTRDKVRFSVRDTGAGMSDDVKKKIFDPFFTTKGQGKGTGLGLSITYNIVYDQHRGSIDIQTKQGEGTTFTVTIPKDVSPSD